MHVPTILLLRVLLTLMPALFPIHLSAIYFLSLSSKLVEENTKKTKKNWKTIKLDPFVPLASPTSQLASIVCNYFQSMCATAYALVYVQTCLIIFASKHMRVREQTYPKLKYKLKFYSFYDQQKIRQPGKTIKGPRSEQVQLLRTIHQYAGWVLEQAQQKSESRKKQKKCGSY